MLLLEKNVKEFCNSRLKYAEFLQHQGYTVAAYIPDTNPELINIIKTKGILVFKYSKIYNLLNLINAIISFKPSIIHSFKFELHVLTVVVNFFSKSKIVLHITGLGYLFTEKGCKYYRVLFLKLIYFILFIRSFKVIFQNEEDRLELKFKGLFSKKYALIKGSGVDLIRFDKRKYNIAEIRKDIIIEENDIVILYVSRFLVQKGILELIEAIEELSFDYPNIKLCVIGSHKLKNKRFIPISIFQKYKNSIKIILKSEINNIEKYFAIADFYVCPSYYREGIPRSSLEALATGLPIISTNIGGCNLTVNHQNGILVEPHSVLELKNAIKNMLKSKFKWNKMGTSSRNLAKKEFANNIIFKQFEKTYNS